MWSLIENSFHSTRMSTLNDEKSDEENDGSEVHETLHIGNLQEPLAVDKRISNNFSSIEIENTLLFFNTVKLENALKFKRPRVPGN